MSLTQERINEIALEVAHRTAKTYRHKADEPYGFDEDCMIHAFNRFLSRIREEQEAVAWLVSGSKIYEDTVVIKEEWADARIEQRKSKNDQKIPLFAIPPAAPDNEYKEKYLLLSAQYVRDVEQLENDCKELVEVGQKLLARALTDCQSGFVCEVREEWEEALAKHKASLVRLVPHTPEMIAAAWLRDTVEDTNATLDDIRIEFGDEIAALVEMLTDVSTPHDGLRAHRKAKDREHTATASPAAKTIKLADLIDNSRSIIERDPKFARVYLEEKRLLLEVLKEGDPTLWKMAYSIAHEAR